MKKKSWILIFVICLLIVTVFIIIRQLTSPPGSKHISTKEAQNLVQNRYQGSVFQIRLTNDQYFIKMKKEKRIYKIILNANTGEIVSMVKVKGQNPEPVLTETEVSSLINEKIKGTITSIKKERQDGKVVYIASVHEGNQLLSIQVDSVSGTILSTSSTKMTEPSKKLSQADAVGLAVQQVEGTVEKISLETKNGQPYYFVKVKDEEKQEAIVQIHAIKGTVISVTWEGHSKHDSNDDKGK